MSEGVPLTPKNPKLASGTGQLTGAWTARPGKDWSYHLTVVAPNGTGAVSATAHIEVSNDGVNAIRLGDLTANGVDSAGDTINNTIPYAFHRAVIDTITGAGATASVTAAGV